MKQNLKEEKNICIYQSVERYEEKKIANSTECRKKKYNLFLVVTVAVFFFAKHDE